MAGERSGPPGKTSRHSHRNSRGRYSPTTSMAPAFADGIPEMDREIRERVVRLEVKVEQMQRTLDETNETVKELRDMLVAAKGARWVLMALIATGGFLGGVFAKLPAWMHVFPKV